LPQMPFGLDLIRAHRAHLPQRGRLKQDPRIAANALRVGPHPPSSTVPRRSFAPSACRCFPIGEGLFNNEGTQQNNESGDNISDVIQENTVNNNPGTVNIGSPVVIKDTGDTTTVNIG